uniref:CSON002388 protein n=1 Tax=Culicoides sonorensis TaxID=179676 RepID=A0A336LHZ9_CULSO
MLPEAKFGLSQRGQPMLICNGFRFTKDREFKESINWKCSLFRRVKCKGRAISTRNAEGEVIVRVTNAHNHGHHRMNFMSMYQLTLRRQDEDVKSVSFVKSRRGTQCLYYNGFIYTPNQKEVRGMVKRDYKCTMYHRSKCKARALFNVENHSVRVKNDHNHHNRKFRKMPIAKNVKVVAGSKGKPKLLYDGFAYFQNNSYLGNTYWLCARNRSMKCKARIIQSQDNVFDVKPVYSAGNLKLTYVTGQRDYINGVLLDLINNLNLKGIQVKTIFSQRKKPKIILDGHTFCCAKLIRERGYWVCSKEKSKKCRARLISDTIQYYFKTIANPDSPKNKPITTNRKSEPSRKAEIVLDDQTLDVVVGQRGKELLLFDGFTFSKNNSLGVKTYWACRTRNSVSGACKARVTTIQKANGLHYIIVTKPEHNHSDVLIFN